MKTPKEEQIEAIRKAVEDGVTDKAYWHSRTPEERIWAMELMRRLAYGYDENRIPERQRVIEFATLKRYDAPKDTKKLSEE
jgi:hypothetical protein